MNRYEFEDKISDYLDNQLSISERRKFESFLDKDSEARDLLKSVRKTIDLLDTSWPQKASEEFLPNLLKRIEAEKSNIRIKSHTNGKTLLWKVKTANKSVAPDYLSNFWVKGDGCSKRLDGCKMRFGFQPINSGTASSTGKADPNTEAVLPFGGFPAAKSFS